MKAKTDDSRYSLSYLLFFRNTVQSNTPKALGHKFMTVKSESASNTFYYFNTDPIVKTHYYENLFTLFYAFRKPWRYLTIHIRLAV